MTLDNELHVNLPPDDVVHAHSSAPRLSSAVLLLRLTGKHPESGTSQTQSTFQGEDWTGSASRMASGSLVHDRHHDSAGTTLAVLHAAGDNPVGACVAGARGIDDGDADDIAVVDACGPRHD